MDMRVAPKTKMKLVMIGNGMAGVRTIEELLKIAPDLYDITVFGAEPHPNYNRILLSPVLAGEQTLEEIVLNDWAWYTDHGIHLHAGWKVTEVDRVNRLVHAQNSAGETMNAYRSETPSARGVRFRGGVSFIESNCTRFSRTVCSLTYM